MSIYSSNLDLEELFGKTRIEVSDFICLPYEDIETDLTTIVVTPKYLYETKHVYCDQSAFTLFATQEALEALNLFESKESVYETEDSLREIVTKLSKLGVTLDPRLQPLVDVSIACEDFIEKIEDVTVEDSIESIPSEPVEEVPDAFMSRWNLIVSYNNIPVFSSMFETMKNVSVDSWPARKALQWVLYRRSKLLKIESKEELHDFSEKPLTCLELNEAETTAVSRWECEFRPGDILSFTFFPHEELPLLKLVKNVKEIVYDTVTYNVIDRDEDGLDFYFEGMRRISLMPDNKIYVKVGMRFQYDKAPVEISREAFIRALTAANDEVKNLFATGTEAERYVLGLRLDFFGEIEPKRRAE